MAAKSDTWLMDLISEIESDTEPKDKRNKTIRLRPDYNAKIRDRAHDRSTETQLRITESDIIDDALTLYFAVMARRVR